MNDRSAPKASGLAVTSLVLGILSVICCGLLTGLPAIICGHVAYGKVRRSQGRLGGEGLAMVGFILGYLSLVTTLILIAIAVPAVSAALQRGKMTQQLNNARQIHLAITQMSLDGSTTGDKTSAYPADAGITTVSALKSRLIEKGYLSEEDANKLGFEDFLIANVSESDPAMTIFIKSRPDENQRSSFIMFKGGDGHIVTSNSPAPEGNDPPRDPAYLAP